MAQIPGLTDGNAADHDLWFDNTYGVGGKDSTNPALFFLTQALGVLSQDIGMGGVTHTLVLGTAIADQTKIIAPILNVDAEGGAPALIFPAESAITDLTALVINTGGETINIQNDTPATILALATGNAAIISCDGTTLRGYLLQPDTAGASDFGALGLLADAIAESTAAAGVGVVSRLTTTDGVTGGTAKVVGGRADNIVAPSAAIGGSTAEVAFDENYTLPAATLQVGSIIKIRGFVEATTTVSTDTLTIKVKLGSTILLESAAVNVSDNDTCYFDTIVSVRTIGGSGTMVGSGLIILGTESSAKMDYSTLASTAVDTTGTLLVSVTAQWSTTEANSCRLDQLYVEIV